MHLVYFDESGNSGAGLADTAQPVFVLCALLVPEAQWMALERDLQSVVEAAFQSPRPDDFEIHANELANPRGFFRAFPIAHRLKFRDSLFEVARQHSLRVIYRAIEKKRFQKWVASSLGAGVSLNPHIAAFPLVSARCRGSRWASSSPTKTKRLCATSKNPSAFCAALKDVSNSARLSKKGSLLNPTRACRSSFAICVPMPPGRLRSTGWDLL
jgi:hypothetical protein